MAQRVRLPCALALAIIQVSSKERKRFAVAWLGWSGLPSLRPLPMRSQYVGACCPCCLLSRPKQTADVAGRPGLARRLLVEGYVRRLTVQEATAYRPKGSGTAVAVKFQDEGDSDGAVASRR